MNSRMRFGNRGVLLWLTGMAVLTTTVRAEPPSSQPEVRAVVDRAAKVYRRLRSFSATITIRFGAETQVGRIECARPNRWRWEQTLPAAETVVSTGSDVYRFVGDGASDYRRFEPGAAGENLELPLASAFFRSDRVLPMTEGAELRSIGRRSLRGRAFDAIEIRHLPTGPRSGPHRWRTDLCYFERETGLLVRVESRTASGQSVIGQRDTELSDVRLNPSLHPKRFVWSPPAEARVIEQPMNEDFLSRLPARGTRPADFRLLSTEGRSRTLSDLLRGKRALLLNFWSFGCGPCRKELPILNALLKERSSEGFAVVGINPGDPVATVHQLWNELGIQFPSLIAGGKTGFDIESRLGVFGFPTHLLLDGEGRVVYRSIGLELTPLLAMVDRLTRPAQGSRLLPPELTKTGRPAQGASPKSGMKPE